MCLWVNRGTRTREAQWSAAGGRWDCDDETVSSSNVRDGAGGPGGGRWGTDVGRRVQMMVPMNRLKLVA